MCVFLYSRNEEKSREEKQWGKKKEIDLTMDVEYQTSPAGGRKYFKNLLKI
jgi:hypothetical protein